MRAIILSQQQPDFAFVMGAPVLGPQQLDAAGAMSSLRRTTPASAASVSRDGYEPSTAIAVVDEDERQHLVAARERLFHGGRRRERSGLRGEVEPLDLDALLCSQATSAAKRASSGSEVGPQTPVEQHMAGSKTRMVGIVTS